MNDTCDCGEGNLAYCRASKCPKGAPPVFPDTPLDFEKARKDAVAAFCVRFECAPEDIKRHEDSLFSVGVWIKRELEAQHTAALDTKNQEIETLTAERDAARIWGKKMEAAFDRAEELARTNRGHYATLQAQHDTLRGVVREWSDAWFAYNGIVNAIHATGPEIEAADVRLDKAAHALASYPVEGTRE